MGGHGKSKRNKNKGKSKKYSKPNNEKLLDQGHEKQIGETSSTSGAKETTADHEENISPISERYCDCMLEDVLFKKVQILYMKVEIKLLELGYKPEETRRAILLNGSICGKENIFRNILLNTLVMIKKERRDGINGFEPVYKDVAELARFSANALMNMIRQDHPSLSEKEVSRFVLECGLLEEYDEHHDDDDNDLAEGLKNASVTDVGKVLMETTLYLQRLRISPPPAPEQEQTVDEDHELSSGELFESDIVDSQDKINLKEWLKFCSESSKDNMSSEFVEQIEYLTRQVKERKEWAQRVVNQAYQRFKETRAELRNLKLWKLESLVKENEQVDRMNSMINERENALRTLMTYLNSTIAPKKRFEAKNAVINADIAAYDLNTNENIKFLLEAQKKEKRTLTKCNDTRKKVDDLNAQIEEMKQKIAETAHKMQQVNDSQEQAKLRLRQEEEEKALAHALLLEEKRINRLEKENSKWRLAALKQELYMNNRRMVDENNRLELQLSQLKAIHDQKSSTAESSSSSIQCSRRQCIICRKNDVCILFQPCAHQVICLACNSEVFKELENYCPCCSTRIEKRVKVYGPSSY